MTGIGEVFLTALGPRAEALHPALRAQLRDPRRRQVLSGRFPVAGSRLGALNALARPAVGPAALLTRYERDVPFQVELSATADADGRPVLHTTRRFGFRSGQQTLLDALYATAEEGVLRSRLGARGRVEVLMVCDVTDDGALVLVSRRVSLRLGRIRMPLPRGLSPAIRVRDGWDDAHQRRTIDMTAGHPLVGGVLEYRGWFVSVDG